MEHLATFGLDRDPFGSDVQLAWYYEGAAFADATRRLHRAAQQGKGLCLVTGRGGVGKTMLVRHLLEALEEEMFEACMVVPVPGISDLRWLLTRFAQQLGIDEPAGELAAVLAQIYEQLAVVREDGRNPVLIIDEAHALAERGLLAELRGLLNLEYEERRLLTLILVGSPALADAVAREPALCERVDTRLVLPPLATKEVVPYLHHRIRAAGGNPAILESGAVQLLTRLSEGVPRRINTLADNALFEAHVAGRVSATAADVERAGAELGPSPAFAPAADPAAAAPFSAARSPEAPVAAAPLAPARGQALGDLDTLFDAPEEELELGEVVAEPTGRRGAAAQTVALFGEGEGDDLLSGVGSDDSGELEDLFADIVEE